MEELLCCESRTFISMLIVAITIGLILSCLYVSLIGIILFGVIIEAVMYFTLRRSGQWNAFSRISLFFGYIAGWIAGRTVYRMKTYIISKEIDKMLGII